MTSVGSGLARIALMVGLLAVAGCGRATGVLEPVAETAPGSSQVDLLVATTRSATGATPGEMFTGERGRDLAFADIVVSIPPDKDRKAGDVQWPESNPGNPGRDFVTLRAQRLERDQAIAEFNKRIVKTPQRQVLVFVHGYNTTFEDAVFRFAQIVHDSEAPAVPVLFTWPSRGKLLAYTYDRESANYSRDALENLLHYLAQDKNVGEISILAHSMGNWVTLEALRQMAIRDKRIAPKITNVMLAAPDVDYDVFTRQIAEIGENRPPFTMFVSQDDEALAVSRRVWGGVARVGAVNPNVEPYRSEFEKNRISVIDLTDVKSSDSLKHGKFASAPDVVRSIGLRLAQGQTLSDGKAGFGERLGMVATGAVSTVGSAAGLVVSAPLAIVDRRTRDSFGDRLQDIGDRATSTLSGGDVGR